MKEKFENVLAWLFFITLAIGFLFPLIWVITGLVFLVSVSLGDSVLALDNMVKNNLSSLVQGNSITFEKYSWNSVKSLTSISKVVHQDDGYIELIYHYEDAQLPIIVKAKRHWFRKSKCDLTLTVLVVSKTASNLVQKETKQLRNEAVKELLQANINLTTEEIEEAKRQMSQRF